LILAFDRVSLAGPEALPRFAALAGAIEAQAGARLPGMRRLEARRKAQRDGVVVAEALLAEIEAA
jgi:(2R)-3-sulfolactate dehydrogenase (NADP+)